MQDRPKNRAKSKRTLTRFQVSESTYRLIMHSSRLSNDEASKLPLVLGAGFEAKETGYGHFFCMSGFRLPSRARCFLMHVSSERFLNCVAAKPESP